MKKLLILLLVAVPLVSIAQLPDPYKHVDQVMWVVKDLSKVTSGWRSMGFNQIMEIGPMELPNQEYKGTNTNVRAQLALARLNNINVTWIQPEEGENAFSEHLEKYGDGAFSLVHRFNSSDEMKKEEERLNKLGINTLQKGSVYTDAGTVTMIFMDTMEKGKYILGFIHGPVVHAQEVTGLTNLSPLNATFSQYAFAITDPKPISAFWQKVGLPAFDYTTPEVWEKRYYGKEADFAMDLGWQRHGDVVYEWRIPKKEPTVYADHIKKHGEGIQHIAFNVEDMDKAIADLVSKGFAISQSGGWGEKNKPGSGRFAYVDTEGIGGLTVELLWSYK